MPSEVTKRKWHVFKQKEFNTSGFHEISLGGISDTAFPDPVPFNIEVYEKHKIIRFRKVDLLVG